MTNMAQDDSQFDVEAAWEKPHAARSLLQVLWHRKAFVLLGAFVGLAMGFLYHSQRTAVYQSSCQLLVIKKRASEALQVNAANASAVYVEDYTATHAALLRTPLILERAVKRSNLGALKTFENVGEPAAMVAGGLNVVRDTKETGGTPNNIIVLTYRGPIAEDCGKVLAAVLDSYQEFLDTTYRNISDETLQLITKARDVLTKDLKESEARYNAFRETSPTVFKNKDGVNAEHERVAAILSECTQLELKRNQLRERIRGLETAIKEGKGAEVLIGLARGGTTPDGKQGATERYVQEPLLPLIMQKVKLEEDFGPDHPAIKSVDRQIATMREHLSKISPQSTEKDPAKRALAALQFELAEIELIVQSQAEILEKSKAAARSLLKYDIEENHLLNDVVRLRQIHEGTIKRLQEINLVRDSGGFTAKALSTPGAGAKIAPVAYQDIGMVLMLGVLLGVGLAYLAELSDKSFRSPEEVRRRLGLPIVGHIPFITADAEAERKRAAGEPSIDPMLVTYFRPKSLEAEAYRAVRTALYFATQGVGHKVIQVTSPNKSDGKSLMIANLAIMVAQSGKRVLLIDADLRRPRQHKIFGVESAVGLSGVLGSGAPATDAIQATCIAGLTILPCGPVPANPSELLTSPRFKELLEAMRNEYDYVLVDTPPLLAVTDPCIVAGRTDGLFLTIRLTRKGRPDAERARELLAGLHVKMLGVVVNGISRGAAGIYSPNAYDYTETYDQDEPDGDEQYYYYEQDETAAVKTQTPADDQPHATGTTSGATNGSSRRPGAGGKSFWNRWWPGT
jgi:capsular exopolysaccharide synthesis family protein